MENTLNWSLTDAEKTKFIAALTPELVLLRTKAGVSHEELAGLIGVSRQTYSALERKVRKMSWSTYLSLILFYDCNQKTHQLIRSMGVFPHDILKKFNGGQDPQMLAVDALACPGMESVFDSLDEQALRSIRTMILVEYARCTSTPGDVVVRSFDGVSFTAFSPDSKKAAQALKAIKENKKAP